MVGMNHIVSADTNSATRRTDSYSAMKEAKKPVEAQKLTFETRVEEEPADKLENIVSVSEDGDTVQVSEKSMDRLEEDRFGKLTLKEFVEETVQDSFGKENEDAKEIREMMEEEAQKVKEMQQDFLKQQDAARNRIKEIMQEQIKADSSQKEEKQETVIDIPVSTMGRTVSELEQMFMRGDISRNEMDQAIGRQEQRREEFLQQEDRFTTETAGVVGLMVKQKNDAIEIKEIFGENGSDVIDAAARTEIMEALQTQTVDLFQ